MTENEIDIDTLSGAAMDALLAFEAAQEAKP
jgi:hypothetical protein